MPLIAQDPTRLPDRTYGGPDLPVGETVRLCFFRRVLIRRAVQKPECRNAHQPLRTISD